jgi:ribonuclease P protein component
MRNPRSARPRASGRLSRSAEFERVYRQGRSTANRHLVLYAFANPAAERPRLGLSVSRKVGNAVQRNKVKRLLREAFAHAEPGVAEGHDIVLVARPPAGDLAEREGLHGMAESLSELIAKAGLVREVGRGEGQAVESAASSEHAGQAELASGELADAQDEGETELPSSNKAELASGERA